MIDFSALGIDKSAEVRLDRLLMRQAYEVALSDGKGAVQYKGKPIDAASMRMVDTLIAQADLIGM